MQLEIDGEAADVPVVSAKAEPAASGPDDSALVAKLIRRDGTRVVLDMSGRVVSARIVAAGATAYLTATDEHTGSPGPIARSMTGTPTAGSPA